MVTDRFGSWHAPVPATTEVPRGARVVVAVKAEGVVAAERQLVDAEPTEVVALLNGLEHMEALRAASPGATVVGATIAGETLRTGIGEDGPVTVRHRNELLRVVVPDDAWDLGIVRALRDTDMDVVMGGTEAEVMWKKLRFLAPFALLTSTWESGIGDAIDADPGMATALVGEVAAVATAEGVPTTGAELLELLRGFPRTMRSSLQADIGAGKPGELDAIGGAVVRRGAAHGIDTPVVAATVERLGARVAG
jgi:2-dehydropantoate 2-reductase